MVNGRLYGCCSCVFLFLSIGSGVIRTWMTGHRNRDGWLSAAQVRLAIVCTARAELRGYGTAMGFKQLCPWGMRA